MSLKDKNVIELLLMNDNYEDFCTQYLSYHEKINKEDYRIIDINKILTNFMQRRLDLLNISKMLWAYKPIYIKKLRISKLKRLLDN